MADLLASIPPLTRAPALAIRALMRPAPEPPTLAAPPPRSDAVRRPGPDALAACDREYRRLLGAVEWTFSMHRIGCRAVADLGCGTGRAAAAVQRALEGEARLLVAVDRSEEMVQFARRTLGAAREVWVRRGDVLDPHLFAPRSLDAVNATHVLSESGRPREVLANVARWLRPGGLLVVADLRGPAAPLHRLRGMASWAWADARGEGRSSWGAAAAATRWLWSVRGPLRENLKSRAAVPARTTAELRSWMEAAGFEMVALSGDWERDPITGAGLADLAVARARG